MGTAAISFGPKLGLLNNAAIGEQYYDQFRPFLRGIDALIMGSIKSLSLTAPPSSPANGDAYLLYIPGQTGAWAGHDGAIAVWSTQVTDAGGDNLDPAWDFYTPKAGWIIYDTDPSFPNFLSFDGTNWAVFAGGDVKQNPTANQTITQPDGTVFEVTNNSSNGTHSAFGVGNNIGGGTGGQSAITFNGYIYLPASSERITVANYKIGVDDLTDGSVSVSYVTDATSNNVEIDLPFMDGVFNGWTAWFIVSRNDVTKATGHTVTIKPSGGNTIAGQASVTLADWGSYTFMYTATGSGGQNNDWIITSKV